MDYVIYHVGIQNWNGFVIYFLWMINVVRESYNCLMDYVIYHAKIQNWNDFVIYFLIDNKGGL